MYLPNDNETPNVRWVVFFMFIPYTRTAGLLSGCCMGRLAAWYFVGLGEYLLTNASKIGTFFTQPPQMGIGSLRSFALRGGCSPSPHQEDEADFPAHSRIYILRDWGNTGDILTVIGYPERSRKMRFAHQNRMSAMSIHSGVWSRFHFRLSINKPPTRELRDSHLLERLTQAFFCFWGDVQVDEHACGTTIVDNTSSSLTRSVGLLHQTWSMVDMRPP